MKRPIRFGLIGTGPDARVRARVLAQRHECEIIATSGPGAAIKQAIHYEDAKGLLARADLDAVVYAGASKDAAEICALATKRALHVLSLRPPAVSPSDLITMREAQRSAPMGKIIQFSFPLHYHASVGVAKRLAKDGGLGTLLTMRGVYGGAAEPKLEDRGGALLDRGMQMIDLMQAFSGRFAEVKGFIAQRAWDNPGADDNAVAILRTPDNIVAQIHASSTSWRETFRLELGFSHGYIWLDGLIGGEGGLEPEMLIVGRPKADENGVPMPNPDEDIQEFKTDNSIELEVSDFLHAVQGRGPQTVGTTLQAFDALTLVHRIYGDDPSWVPENDKAAAE